MITATEALEMANEKGERLKLIKEQMENANSVIVDACLQGLRMAVLDAILSEVRFQLIKCGYDLQHMHGSERVLVRW